MNAALSIPIRSKAIFSERLNRVHCDADHLFAKLIVLQWLAGIFVSLWISPLTWSGFQEETHIHVYAAILLGGIISVFPLFMALKYPGYWMTRHSIALGQASMSALLIHLCGGRIETHFHVFGSLAFLACYRDWKVLISYSAVVAFDHFFRGMFWPESVYGVVTTSAWRWLEHAGWVVFEDIFLIIFIRQSLHEMKASSDRQAELEEMNRSIESKIKIRTKALQIQSRQQDAVAFLGQNGLRGMKSEDLMFLSANLVCENLDLDCCRILEWDLRNCAFKEVVCVSRPNEDFLQTAIVQEDHDFNLYSLRAENPVILNDYDKEGRFKPVHDDQGTIFKSAISSGIYYAKKTFGIMVGYRERPSEFSEEAIHFVQNVSGVISLTIEREEAEAALSKSERRFRLITENAVELIAVVDRAGAFSYASPSFTSILGYPTVSIENQCIYDLIDREDHAEFEATFLSDESESESVPPSRIYRFRHADKSWRDVEATAVLVGNELEEDEEPKIVFVGRDITSRLKAEREREKLEMHLRQAQKLESIGQMAAGIAHEINTPIQYIGDNLRFLSESFEDMVEVAVTYRSLLQEVSPELLPGDRHEKLVKQVDEMDLDFLVDEIPESLEQSLEGVGRVAKIVKAMKDFSHPGTESLTLMDISGLIESTVTVAHNEWKYVAELETDFDPNLNLVPVFPDEFNQVILNLIVNASHTIADVVGESGKKGKIQIRTLKRDGVAEVRVSDTGKGIPEENRSKIFDPFFTTKQVGKGTGQGLALAYSVIAEMHNGKLLLESEVGVGTTFIIELPLKQERGEAGNVRTVVET